MQLAVTVQDSIYILILAFVLVYYLRPIIKEKIEVRENSKAEILTIPVTVQSRRKNLTRGSRTCGGVVDIKEKNTVKFITKDNDVLELEVPKNDYLELYDGDEISLTYQRKKYIGFSKQAFDNE